MIISGGSRCNWRFFSKHLMKLTENDYVRVAEIRGLASDNVLDAFREMDALASGTQCKNFFYHANINPREDEHLTADQWDQAVDELEKNLGLEGHSRFVVEHEKLGRTHRHVIWSRVDVDTMTVVSDSRNFARHEKTARELEKAFGHEPVQGVHGAVDLVAIGQNGGLGDLDLQPAGIKAAPIDQGLDLAGKGRVGEFQG